MCPRPRAVDGDHATRKKQRDRSPQIFASLFFVILHSDVKEKIVVIFLNVAVRNTMAHVRQLQVGSTITVIRKRPDRHAVSD